MSAIFVLGTDEHGAWLQAQTTSLLSFYERSVDLSAGGFDELSMTGVPMRQPKPLFATARMTYGFALGHLVGHPGSARLVEHGLDALRSIFHDAEYGGWLAKLGADGTTTEDPAKQTYGHAFVLLAASAAAQAGFASDDLFAEASTMFERYLYEPSQQLCSDAWDRQWVRCDAYRGMNANMHTVEAFLGAYAATRRPEFFERACTISTRMIAFAESMQWRIPEHFTDDWKPLPDFNRNNPGDRFKPYGSTPGHGLEWSRLLLQLRLIASTETDAARTPDSSALLHAAENLFDRAVIDGWDLAQHGFSYTVDWNGRTVAPQRLHWPLAEAIGAARYLYDATGDPRYSSWYGRFWQLVDGEFIDHEYGSWWHELNAEGRPGTTVWAGKGDLYHSLQATLFGQLPATPTLAGLLAVR